MANSILADQLTGSNLGLKGQAPPIQPGVNGVTPPKYSDTFSEE
jgi:hypothetical protein